MKKIAPTHIVDFCIDDTDDLNYMKLKNTYVDEYSFVYKVRCKCGNEKFIVYQDEHPSVWGKCLKCNKVLTIYNLEYYPAATKLKEIFESHKLILQNEYEFNIYVEYEYSDEFLYSDEENFDPNDITWAMVFVKGERCFEMILNDETA